MVAGIIKYGERTWSLWLGSSNKFRESILPPPNPGPNYAYFSCGLAEKLNEGYKVKSKVESTPISFDYSQTAIANESIQDAFFLQHGFYLFTIFEFLFADLILSIQDHHNSQYFFRSIPWDDAFKLIEVELGLMYDKLYTKAVATYSRLGIFLKFVSFFCTFSAFITFRRLIDKSNRVLHRGDRVLHKWNCHSIDWSTKDEFDKILLLWHIATHLWHYSDVTADSSSTVIENYQISKLLSNYMLYLLVKCPFMLPNGIGQIRFEDTCAGASELLQEEMYISERDQLCKLILQVDTDVSPSVVIGEQSKSVLFDASRLAKSLESLEKEKKWSKERKSEIIRDVWVEMLCHAASQCKGRHHAKQLSRGGELLTHVWFLMAHLGITEQFQISQGHARAKLILS